MTGTDAPVAARRSVHERLELVAAVMLAVATVATAWSAFQSAKWGGVQAASYAAAGAARTESNRATTLAGQQTIIDVQLFTDWLQAVNEEQGQVLPTPYEPTPGTYSAFLYERFRDEFRPALHAWLAEEPLANPDAPPSPFAMDEYVLAESTRAHGLDLKADAAASRAHAANATKDNYVLATVMCASVLFFGGIGARLSSRRARGVMVLAAGIVLLATVLVLLTYPVRI